VTLCGRTQTTGTYFGVYETLELYTRFNGYSLTFSFYLSSDVAGVSHHGEQGIPLDKTLQSNLHISMDYTLWRERIS